MAAYAPANHSGAALFTTQAVRFVEQPEFFRCPNNTFPHLHAGVPECTSGHAAADERHSSFRFTAARTGTADDLCNGMTTRKEAAMRHRCFGKACSITCAALVLCGGTVLVARGQRSAAPDRPSARLSAPGFRVDLDDSGKPIAPRSDRHSVTVEESAESESAAADAPAAEKSKRPAGEQNAPGGGKMIEDDRFQDVSVGRLGTDGHVSIHCEGAGVPAASQPSSSAEVLP